jgi:hypothetical protein
MTTTIATVVFAALFVVFAAAESAAAAPATPPPGMTFTLSAGGASMLPPGTGAVGWAGGPAALSDIEASVFAPSSVELHNAVFTLTGPGADDAHPYSESIVSPAVVIVNYQQGATFHVPLRAGLQTLTLTVTADGMAPFGVEGSITGEVVKFAYAVQFRAASGDWVGSGSTGTVRLPKDDMTAARLRVTNRGTIPATILGYSTSQPDAGASGCPSVTLAVGASASCVLSDADFTVADRLGPWQAGFTYSSAVHDGAALATSTLVVRHRSALAATGTDAAPALGLSLAFGLLVAGVAALALRRFSKS